MKVNKVRIVIFLVAVSIMMGSASAATIDVNSGMTNAQIQGNITAANSGDTINFAPGTYSGTYLTINKALNLIGNGANLVGSGTSIFTITGTTGVSIKGFNININNRDADGITGSNVYNCTIKNNTITNGEDGINIFMLYANLTINNNTINDMAGTNGDGISLVNHNTAIDMSAFVPSTITNNHISNTLYGMFIGGNFKGNVTGNSISGTTAGMTITGKKAATNGTISQLGTTGYSILINTYYYNEGSIYVTNNAFSNIVSQDFHDDADITGSWSGNTLNGQPYP